MLHCVRSAGARLKERCSIVFPASRHASDISCPACSVCDWVVEENHTIQSFVIKIGQGSRNHSSIALHHTRRRVKADEKLLFLPRQAPRRVAFDSFKQSLQRWRCEALQLFNSSADQHRSQRSRFCRAKGKRYTNSGPASQGWNPLLSSYARFGQPTPGSSGASASALALPTVLSVARISTVTSRLSKSRPPFLNLPPVLRYPRFRLPLRRGRERYQRLELWLMAARPDLP